MAHTEINVKFRNVESGVEWQEEMTEEQASKLPVVGCLIQQAIYHQEPLLANITYGLTQYTITMKTW